MPNSKDEIESLIYALFDLSNIKLPWFEKDFFDSDDKKLCF